MTELITAAELIAQLEADSDFLARRKRQSEELQQRVVHHREAEAVLVQELEDAGISVDSASDLIPLDFRVDRSAPHPEALPILVRHLSEPYPDAVLESIARALGVKEAKFAWSTLVHHYRAAGNDTGFKDGLAAAMAVVCDEDLIEDVISLLRDRAQGSSRILLLTAIGRSDHPLAHQTLLDLANDPDLKKEIRFMRRSKRSKSG